MIIAAEILNGYPVLSLHVSGQIASVTEIIVDPNDLKVVAFRVAGPEVGGEVGEYLRENDVREFSDLGMVVNSLDEFVNPDDVIKLGKIIELNFDLIGMKVETKKGTKLGKVTGYMVNTNGWLVQTLIVQRPLVKSFLDPELVIWRSEVVKIDDYKIIVKDEEDKIRSRASKEDFIPDFVNPFRKPQIAAAGAEADATAE